MREAEGQGFKNNQKPLKTIANVQEIYNETRQLLSARTCHAA